MNIFSEWLLIKEVFKDVPSMSDIFSELKSFLKEFITYFQSEIGRKDVKDSGFTYREVQNELRWLFNNSLAEIKSFLAKSNTYKIKGDAREILQELSRSLRMVELFADHSPRNVFLSLKSKVSAAADAVGKPTDSINRPAVGNNLSYHNKPSVAFNAVSLAKHVPFEDNLKGDGLRYQKRLLVLYHFVQRALKGDQDGENLLAAIKNSYHDEVSWGAAFDRMEELGKGSTSRLRQLLSDILEGIERTS